MAMGAMREYKDGKGMEVEGGRSICWVLDVNYVFGEVIKPPAG